MYNPLFTNDYYFPAFIVILMITLVCSSPMRGIRISINKVDLLVIVFGAYYLTRSLVETPFGLSVYDFYFTICYLLLYACIKVLASTDNGSQNILCMVILVIFLCEGTLTIAQFSGLTKGKNQFFNASGSFVSPALLTNFMCIAFPLLEKYFLQKHQQRVAFALLCLLGLVCFMTDSKLSWLVFAALVVFKLMKSSKKQISPYYYATALAGVALIIVAIVMQDSTSGRFLVLKGTYSLWSQNVLNGIGINQFDRQYNLFQAEFLSHNDHSPYYYLASYVQVAYNDFLQIILETGIFGLLFFAYVITITVRNWSRYPGYLREAFLIITIVAMFSFPFQTSSTLTLCIVYSALASGFHSPLVITDLRALPIKPSLALMGLFMFVLSFKIQNAIFIWKLAVRNPALIGYEKFGKAARILKNNKDFQLSYANMLYLENHHAESVQHLNEATLHSSNIDIFLLLGLNYEATGNLALAESNYLESIKLVPSFLKPKFLLMKLYLKDRKLQEAKEIAGIIMRSKIKIKNKEANYILATARKISTL